MGTGRFVNYEAGRLPGVELNSEREEASPGSSKGRLEGQGSESVRQRTPILFRFVFRFSFSLSELRKM